MSFNEFDLINVFFNRKHSLRNDVLLGIGDDCALCKINKENIIATSMDTLVSGIHFLPDIDPIDLSYKSLAINLSDLAAIGADPAWLMLALTLPSLNYNWITSYSNSLFKQLELYNIKLIGGNISKGPLSLTMTIFGLIPKKCSVLSRDNAKVGDLIYVTGTLGDSAAGLAVLQKNLQISNYKDKQYLIMRHLRPDIRIIQGKMLRNLANSMIDISDGIINDLNHIITQSNCSAQIYVDRIPHSSILKKYLNHNQILNYILSGGEDYELCFTISQSKISELNNIINSSNVKFTCIGQIKQYGTGIQLINNKNILKFKYSGFSHF